MAANINRVVLVGNLTKDPELRHTRRRHARLQPRASPSTAAGGTSRASGPTSPTTSASPSSATRPRAARSTCEGPPGRDRRSPRLARVGGAGRRASARPWRSSPRASSSSAAAATVRRGRRRRQPVRAGRRGAGERRLPGRGRRRHPVLGEAWRERRPSRQRRRPGGPAGAIRRRNCFFCKEQGRGDRLQEHQPAAPLHLGEGQDPQPPHHRRVPPAPGAGRDGRQAGARDGAPAVRRRGRRAIASAAAAGAIAATGTGGPLMEVILL